MPDTPLHQSLKKSQGYSKDEIIKMNEKSQLHRGESYPQHSGL